MKSIVRTKATFFLVLFIMIPSCSNRSTSETTPSSLTVNTEKVKRETVLSEFSVVGTIQANKEVLISSRLNGPIDKVYFDKGASVSKGETIAEIENIDLALYIKEAESALDIARNTKEKMSSFSRQQEVRSAEAELAKAKANLDQETSNRKRIKNLFEQKAVSKQQYDLSERQYKIAKAQYDASSENLSLVKSGARTEDKQIAAASVKQAEAHYALAKKKFEDSFIIAPLSGAIVEKYVEQGEIVSYGTPIVKIIDIRSVKIEVKISQNTISRVSYGMDVRITTDALPNQEFHGSVSNVGIAADLQTRTFPVEISVKNDGEHLKPGMTALVTLIKEKFENALTVPKDAVITEFGVDFLYVAKEGKVKRRVVKLGSGHGDRVIVENGVGVNESIVTVGKEALSDGVFVKIEE